VPTERAVYLPTLPTTLQVGAIPRARVVVQCELGPDMGVRD
jgi:hypothetical protein